MKKKKLGISRRVFIGQASCLAVGSTSILSSILNLGMINTAAARPHIISNKDDYKAMVCILLAGGIDSHNVLVPTEQTQYDEYAVTRGSLALTKDGPDSEILPLNYNNNGNTYGINHNMPEIQNLFNTGELSFVSNIGSLVEPIINKADYQSGLKKIPLGLYSHSDQIMHWQTSIPQSRTAVGFAGRMADILHDMNTIPEISMNISFSGKNIFQASNSINELSLRIDADEFNVGFSNLPWWWQESGSTSDLKEQVVSNMMDQKYKNIFNKTYANLSDQAFKSSEVLAEALARVNPLITPFSDTRLSESLETIAKLIQVRSHLGSQRQIFFITYGGWDHHDDVKTNQDRMLPVVSQALSEFNSSLKELNMHENVVTFTISDFGRTLTSNGNGSDHAWGGNQMIMGGPINGGQVFGEYPSLRIDNNDLNISSRGRIIPQISVDEFYAELALWYGASPHDLNYILPNLCNFYSPGNCPSPVPSNYMPIGMFT